MNKTPQNESSISIIQRFKAEIYRVYTPLEKPFDAKNMLNEKKKSNSKEKNWHTETKTFDVISCYFNEMLNQQKESKERVSEWDRDRKPMKLNGCDLLECWILFFTDGLVRQCEQYNVNTRNRYVWLKHIHFFFVWSFPRNTMCYERRANT